ncbi:SDR family NAD(P)-dependent oxidoreductase [uncultured Desulfosarcina sp.]|uniref:SDR family oxidoreductase n=1 Tax=uncultured Desulfosarcina sp. TaxID=218289 RepID=UPI0029C6F321|nr:SDR family NAD(P)-dependent oxidoreductase [uncultured Desulfosarcina sp.]
MALNMDAIGKPIGPMKKDYTWKDAVLYALGVGAGFSELDYCYEKDLKVIPSFSIATIFDFLSQAAIASGVNLAGILHGEQELIFHNPIPSEGTLTTTGKIVDYYDKGKDKGALVVYDSETVHSSGKKLFTSVVTLFGRLDGGFGGKDRKKEPVAFPDREPDFTVEAAPSLNQPLIYRLSGDVFHLHVDPEFARMAGFEKPIMHGLCTHGFACRALIASLVPGRPEQVRRMACRFSKTLYPGVPIRTLIWQTGDGQAVWRTVNAESGEIVIDNGEFEYGDIPKDEIRFDGRTAIVTGAGAGLGRAYALELARRGANVVVNDLGGARDGAGAGSASPADRVVAEIQESGGQAVANYDNVATAEGGANIVKTAQDTFGSVDILINNAGILRDKSFVKMEPDNWQAVLDVHLKGAYNVTRPAFIAMKANGYGRIVMTTSAAGLYGNFGQSNYAAAKMGLVGLMNTLKLEGAKYGIKVNTVAPIAASRLTEDVMPPDLFARSKPEYVAPLVIYLCSDRCPVSGNIYNAGMGFFNRAAVVTGPGRVLVKDGVDPMPETVMENINAISDLSGGKEYGDLNAQVGDALAAFQAPAANATADAAKGFASAAAVFEAMPGAFVPEAAKGVDVVFQYNISGDDGGDWHCIVKDGSCNVAAGVHDSPTCTLKIGGKDFLRMMNGQLPPMQAYTSGKLKIEGDIMKSQLIEKLFRLNRERS